MKLNEVYKNSGLGKWFHKQSATKEPGWDRYNSSGKRVGKCGDAKEGEAYSACLSKQKAKKLGKEGIASFVERKRSAQTKAGRGKKGTGEKGKKPIFVETGAAKKKKVEEQMNHINEECGCEHNKERSLVDKIKNKVKKKYLKETPSIVKSKSTCRVTECMDFTELDLSRFKGKKILIETAEGDWYGTLGVFKGNAALFHGETVHKIIEPSEVVKVVCEDTKVLILEKNKPNDPEKWSACKSAAKSKFDVYPCVPLNSYAITKQGPTNYENLDVGEEILTYNIEKDELEWKPVLNVHYFEKAPLVQIGKPTGFQIKCTPNHKWVVKNGNNYNNTNLIETKDINTHMRLVTCGVLNNNNDLLLENWSKRDSWVENVLLMSKQQREIFLASAIIYDGNDIGLSNKIANRHSFGFTQKNEDHFYATILAAFLNGYHVSFYEKDMDIKGASIIRNKKFHNTQNLTIKNVESEDVWCPETENNTWVMIQNGFITITGNSAYANAWAAKCYKKKGGTWRSVKEQTDLDLELLNETIKHKDGKWVVMNKDETKVLGTHPSKTKALAQLRAIEASKARHGMNENTSILLRDRLRDLFFAPNIAEEVVNKDHKGSMTPAELKKRDEIAAQLRKRGNIKRIKTDERLDSQEEAEYRTATFKVLAMRHGKGKTKKAKK